VSIPVCWTHTPVGHRKMPLGLKNAILTKITEIVLLRNTFLKKLRFENIEKLAFSNRK